jgi:DNA-binding CsgD family transcriptional regulator
MQVLERETEIDALAAIVERGTGGAGGLALIEGPAGIGKSALLECAADAAGAQGMTVAPARAGELERDLPWGIVRELFLHVLSRRSAKEREKLFEGAAVRARAVLYGGGREDEPGGEALAGSLHGLYWLTVSLSQQAPLLVAVDDAQWADTSSLRWIAHLARRIDDLPVVLVLTVRPGEPESSARALAETASRPGAARLRPGPLSQPATKALVAAGLGEPDDEFARACARLTAGNPFYVHELVRELKGAGISPTAGSLPQLERAQPESVAAILRHRLHRLPDSAAAVAGAVAVLGPDATLANAAHLAGVPVEEAATAADALVAADVLRSGLPLEFAHPLVRRVVYSQIPLAERSLTHGRAAGLLREAGAEPASLAVHLLATEPAGDPATVATLERAARDAAARGASDAAATYLRRALAEPAGDAEEPQLLWSLALAEAAVGGPNAVPTFERAIDRAADSRTRARIARDLSRTLRMSGEFPRAAATLEPILAALDPADELSQQVEGELINVAMLSGGAGSETAFARLARFLDPAERERVHDPTLLADLAAAAGVTGQPAALAAELAEKALAAMPAGEAEPSVVAFAAHVLAYCDRFAAARRAADELATHGAASGSLLAYGFAVALRSHVGYREGSLRDAEADARNRLQIARDWPGDPLEPVAFLVDVLVERGQLDEADDLLDPAPLEQHEGRWDALVLSGSRGRLRLAQGDPGAALDDLLGVGEQLVSAGAINPAVMAWRSSAALARHALGERAEALRLATEEVSLARAFGAARALGIALRCRGIVAPAREGLDLLEQSAQVLDGSGARLEHARSLCELGAALRRAGRRGAAAAPLREALDLSARCGAEALAERAREELRAAGARPRRDVLSGRDALTASELRVARMAAGGATNPQIAQSLFVTLRTVETHLTHAYRKLDIRGRTELAGALEREAGVEPTLEPAESHPR